MDSGVEGPTLCGVPQGEVVESTFAEVRHALASSFGCDSDELVVTHSTTDALCKVIAGLELRAGDEILTTNQEHYAALAALAIARDRHGVKIRQVTLPMGDAQCAETYVDLFAAAITRRTKLLLFSAPTFTTGTLLPIDLLARLAQERGLVTLVDAAHLPGMLCCDCHALGVDFLVGSGRKWQFGPPETGLLYIRNKVLPQYNPQPLPVFWPVISLWYPSEGGLPRRTGTMIPSYDIAEYLQTTGSASLTRMRGLQTACQLWDKIGRRRIEDYLLKLAAHLKEQIAGHLGKAALYSPMTDHRLCSALTTFTPFAGGDVETSGARTEEFLRRLEDEHRIRARHVALAVPGSSAPHHAIRCSTRLHHDRDDIDRFVAAVTTLASGFTA